MHYHLFCDSEWKEPVGLDTDAPLQIGQRIYLMDSEDDGRTYRVTEIECTAMKKVIGHCRRKAAAHLGIDIPNCYETSSVSTATLVRISPAELDAGTQPGCATN